MKKRTMKKYIPKNTDYCRDCRNLKYLKTIDDRMIISSGEGFREYTEKKVRVRIYICKYTGATTEYDFLLYDGCKTCCEKEYIDSQFK